MIKNKSKWGNTNKISYEWSTILSSDNTHWHLYGRLTKCWPNLQACCQHRSSMLKVIGKVTIEVVPFNEVNIDPVLISFFIHFAVSFLLEWRHASTQEQLQIEWSLRSRWIICSGYNATDERFLLEMYTKHIQTFPHSFESGNFVLYKVRLCRFFTWFVCRDQVKIPSPNIFLNIFKYFLTNPLLVAVLASINFISFSFI